MLYKKRFEKIKVHGIVRFSSSTCENFFPSKKEVSDYRILIIRVRKMTKNLKKVHSFVPYRRAKIRQINEIFKDLEL